MQNNLPKELLSIRIGLSGTFWDKQPKYSVLVNDKLIVTGVIESSDINYVDFNVEVTEDSLHKLKIRLENKEDSDTIENDDKSSIIKDMLLNIESIEIDDINLGLLMWEASEFTPDDPTRPTLQKCVNLGWNGTYSLEFKSPFYMWLLEKI